MNTTPLASVEMITYNHASYIRKAVEGVLSQQTDFPFELVIGEDCSTDQTREIVLEYQRRYPQIVRVITGDTNVGMHRNVVRTHEASRGEFVAFCEGDDFWHDPAKLQTQVAFLASNPDYGLVHCNYNLFETADGRIRRNMIRSPENLNDNNAYQEVLLRRRRIFTLTVCLRRKLLARVVREHPECTDVRWPMGDTQRWLEVCRLAKVKYLPRAMATYNALPDSASQSRNPAKAFRFAEKAGELILHYLKKYPIEAEDDNQVRRRVASEVLAVAGMAGDRERAQFWFEQLRETIGPVPLDARLHLLEARGRGGRLAAQPVLWVRSNWRHARNRLLRVNRREANGSQ
jgi:glycosyltransferase involved in cell wall biosynthesis